MSMITKRSPVTGEILGEFPITTPEEVNAAVARARAAFPAWRDLGLERRLAALDRVRTVILKHGAAYAQTISDDTGKPLVDSLMTELIAVQLSLAHYRKSAGRILRRRKVKTPIVFSGQKSYVEYFPMGVIGVISPWNFPFQLAFIPVLSALIGGNTVVLKPSEVTPLTGELIRDLVKRAELPPGVVEVIQGDGATGAALVEADIDKVFFTGSLATGRKVMAAAAKKPIPVELELGGKDPMIVCADANLKRAARAAVWGGLINTGQVCVSVERIFVVAEVYDAFVEELRRAVERVTVGAPDEDADVGPMNFPPQLETVDRHVREAVAAGARVAAGGCRIERPGQFYEPTVLTDVTPQMSVYREETFGPVLPLVKVADEDEAVRLANDHEFGLTGSVWTSDVKRGLSLASRLEAGQVMVNDVMTSVANPALPFGGVKRSGFGRYHGDEGLLTFMHTKAIMAGSDKAETEPFWFPYAPKRADTLEAFRLMFEGKLMKTLIPLKRLTKAGLDS